MLTSDDVNTILKRLSLMRPNNRELEKEINAVKSQVMEYLESNEEARYLVDEASNKIKEMGEI